MRIKLIEPNQRKFLELCKEKLNAVSVFSILQFGIDCTTNSLKNYYTQRRLLPEKLFEDLCHLTKINKSELNYKKLEENWGKIKGGKSRKII